MAHNIKTLKISDQDDVKVTFTYQYGTAPTFWWPHWETMCSVPTEKRPVCSRNICTHYC